MTKAFTFAAVAAFGLLAACNQGPAEKAGKAADEQAEAAKGTEYMGDGPREDVGEAIDDANAATTPEAAADAKADGVRAAGEAKADAMEDRADAVRDGTEAKADGIEEKADR